jgi:hypothetical protein
MNDVIIEEIMSHFGRTGDKQRPRIRKFHAELLYNKYLNSETVISKEEIDRPQEYLDRMVKYSKGFLEYINEEAGEIKINPIFFETCKKWERQYNSVEELDHSDENLAEQGIIIKDDFISFDGNLVYSRFYKIISDESESMNDPKHWVFNDKNIEIHEYIDFSKKNTAPFGSRLFLLKFYILRKIDEVAFVTSRFVHCPACGANYVIPASKTEFMATYKCEHNVGEKKCGTTLKKFPARKMIPTYIYEIAVEVKSQEATEYREFFLESFTELTPGFFTGMCFGRTEAKTNSFYFNCLTARAEKAKAEFTILNNPNNPHKFFNLTQSVVNHIKKVGFIIDDEKAQLPVMVETLKKLTLVVNKEVNLDHSLYFGAPGIGKTYALTLLHHLFYSNSGTISGPRFTLAGLTGGQKEIYYQDTAKKKNVPGLFSNQAFLFDEINNAQFLSDDKAINLFKSVALAASGTSSTVGGKEFPRIALISATANYDVNYLRHYENKVRKIYNGEAKDEPDVREQQNFLSQLEYKKDDVPLDFDFYAPLKSYGIDTPKALKTAILKVRDEGVNYMTNFPKPLMERFYWSVLVHPKYDKAFLKQKKIDVEGFLKSRKSAYSQRELISQLYVPDFDSSITEMIKETRRKFEEHDVEVAWSAEVQEFLQLLSNKYIEFFSMFHRINQVHVFNLFALSLINGETHLSFATKRIFERLVSLMHTPILMEDFHKPNFENFLFLGESRGEFLELLKRYPGRDIREMVDLTRSQVKKTITELENNHQIKRIDDYHFEIDDSPRFEKIDGGN